MMVSTLCRTIPAVHSDPLSVLAWGLCLFGYPPGQETPGLVSVLVFFR